MHACTFIYTCTRTHTHPFLQHKSEHVKGTVKVFASYFIIMNSWILTYLVWFSPLYLFFLMLKLTVFGQWEHLQIVFWVLYDKTSVTFLVSLLSDMTGCFTLILYSLIFFNYKISHWIRCIVMPPSGKCLGCPHF